MSRLSNIFSHHSNPLTYYGFKWFGKGRPSHTFVLRNGVKLEVPRRMLHTYKEIFFDDTYFKGIPDLPPGGKPLRIIDVGANVGYFGFFAAMRHPGSKVLAVEPMPQNLALMRKYIAANPGQDIVPIQAGAGATSGKLTLFFDKQDAFTTSATVLSGTDQKDELTVDMVSLADLLKQQGWQAVDFLKLDCEGSEYDVLYSASDDTLKAIHRMAIETHAGSRPDQNLPALEKFLREKGFETTSLRSKLWAWQRIKES
jgi:FkbM family methyltransferase